MLEIKEDDLAVEDNFYPSSNMGSAIVGKEDDDHGEDEVNFYPSGDMVTVNFGSDNNTTD